MKYHLTEETLDARVEKIEQLTTKAVALVTKQAVQASLKSHVLTAAADEQPGWVEWGGLSVVYSGWLTASEPLLAFIEATYRWAVQGLAETLGVAAVFDTVNLVRTTLEDAENKVRGLSTELWTHVQEALSEGVQAGETMEQLAQRVYDAGDLTRSRALATARTEVISAANAGTFDLVSALGLEGTQEWLATPGPRGRGCDLRTRRSHCLADGQTIAVGEKFTVGGFSAQFPADPMLPAGERINCRCTVAFDLDDADAVTASFDPDQPRDDDGRWTDGPSRFLTAVMDTDALAAAPLGIDRQGKVLPSGEADAIRTYRGSDYTPVNRQLRGETDMRGLAELYAPDDTDPDEWVASIGDTITTIKNAMSRSPLGADVATWRGVIDPELMFGSDILDADMTSVEWNEDAFVSTTAIRDIAEGFAGDDSILMRILSPAGTRALQLSSAKNDEAELLLDAGYRMRVVADHGVHPDGYRLLDVEVVA